MAKCWPPDVYWTTAPMIFHHWPCWLELMGIVCNNIWRPPSCPSLPWAHDSNTFKISTLFWWAPLSSTSSSLSSSAKFHRFAILLQIFTAYQAILIVLFLKNQAWWRERSAFIFCLRRFLKQTCFYIGLQPFDPDINECVRCHHSKVSLNLKMHNYP